MFIPALQGLQRSILQSDGLIKPEETKGAQYTDLEKTRMILKVYPPQQLIVWNFFKYFDFGYFSDDTFAVFDTIAHVPRVRNWIILDTSIPTYRVDVLPPFYLHWFDEPCTSGLGSSQSNPFESSHQSSMWVYNNLSMTFCTKNLTLSFPHNISQRTF